MVVAYNATGIFKFPKLGKSRFSIPNKYIVTNINPIQNKLELGLVWSCFINKKIKKIWLIRKEVKPKIKYSSALSANIKTTSPIQEKNKAKRRCFFVRKLLEL
ncbi:hypothetical protein FC1_18310 [Flavobacterium columnare NBRC 100251 = ATCC 23463]|nr:hypothetical protein FC1_18310 [Flavobacterium columnare NBRC 100251 = ATCC 23463]